MFGKNTESIAAEIGFMGFSLVISPLLVLQQRGLSGWLILVLVIIVLMALLIPALLRRDDDPSLPSEAPPTKPTPAIKDASVTENSAVVSPAETAITPVESPPAVDDLSRIEGVGPRISSILQAAGIDTFAALAAADPAQLRQLLQAQKLGAADPTTWPEQAALAAAGKWEALQVLQDELVGGRRAG